MLMKSLEAYAVWRVCFYLCTLVINDSLQPAAGCNEQGQFQPKEQSMIVLQLLEDCFLSLVPMVLWWLRLAEVSAGV